MFYSSTQYVHRGCYTRNVSAVALSELLQVQYNNQNKSADPKTKDILMIISN